MHQESADSNSFDQKRIEVDFCKPGVEIGFKTSLFQTSTYPRWNWTGRSLYRDRWWHNKQPTSTVGMSVTSQNNYHGLTVSRRAIVRHQDSADDFQPMARLARKITCSLPRLIEKRSSPDVACRSEIPVSDTLRKRHAFEKISPVADLEFDDFFFWP